MKYLFLFFCNAFVWVFIHYIKYKIVSVGFFSFSGGSKAKKSKEGRGSGRSKARPPCGLPALPCLACLCLLLRTCAHGIERGASSALSSPSLSLVLSLSSRFSPCAYRNSFFCKGPVLTPSSLLEKRKEKEITHAGVSPPLPPPPLPSLSPPSSKVVTCVCLHATSAF